MKNEVRERFFLVRGEHAAPLIANTLRLLDVRESARKAFREKYGCDNLIIGSRGTTQGLGYNTSDHREGLRLNPEQSSVDDLYWFLPHKGTKLGKQIAKDMGEIPEFSPQQHLVKELKAYQGVSGEYLSGRGFRYHESNAGIVRDAIVLRIPESEEKPFQAPEHFEEIPESQFIAITKEGAAP